MWMNECSAADRPKAKLDLSDKKQIRTAQTNYVQKNDELQRMQKKI